MYTPDILTLSLILFLAMRSKVPGLKGPRILGIIAGDAMRYFLVIFATHFSFEMTMILGRVGLTPESDRNLESNVQFELTQETIQLLPG